MHCWVTKQSLIHGSMKLTISRMENNTRTLTKAFTWQLMGFVLMTIVNYFYMGSLKQGLGLSLLLTLMGLVTYYFHERLWARIAWGRLPLQLTKSP